MTSPAPPPTSPPADPIGALLREGSGFSPRTLRLLRAARRQDLALRRGEPLPPPESPGPPLHLDGRRPAGARLVSIEGLDGSGGTTQLRLLAAALRAGGAAVLTTAEPTRGPIGRLIRLALADPALLGDAVLPLLFCADRADHLEREILPALARGEVVLTDRYVASSLAYQSLAVPMDEVWSLNAAFPPADLTVQLELPVALCLARIEARNTTRDRFETLERLSAVEATYRAGLARLEAAGHPVVHIDADGTPEQVHSRVLNEVIPCLRSKRWAARRIPRSGRDRKSVV